MENPYKHFMLFQHTEKSDFSTTFQVRLGKEVPESSWKQMVSYSCGTTTDTDLQQQRSLFQSQILHSLIFPLSPHPVPLFCHCSLLILFK